MKQKIIKTLLVSTFLVCTGVGVSFFKSNKYLDLEMANIEALARSEGSGCNGCKDIGWGTSQILKCSSGCSEYTGYFSSCNNDSWGC